MALQGQRQHLSRRNGRRESRRPSTADFGGQTQQNILSGRIHSGVQNQQGVFTPSWPASSGGVNVIKIRYNQIHGSAYEFLRNDKMDARNFFVARRTVALKQFGATIGGPVIRNKAFFFLGWEGVRERRGTQISGTVPTDASVKNAGRQPAYAQILALMPPSTRIAVTRSGLSSTQCGQNESRRLGHRAHRLEPT